MFQKDDFSPTKILDLVFELNILNWIFFAWFKWKKNNFQNKSARTTWFGEIAKIHVFCFTVFWVTHLLISCCGFQNLETFPVSSLELSLIVSVETFLWWYNKLRVIHLQNLQLVKAFQIKLVWWSPSPQLDVALL